MKKTKNKSVFMILGIAIFAVLIIYFGMAFYYEGHFLPNTIINGVNCSNKTVDEADKLIAKKVTTYVMKISERNGKTDKIIGNDIDLKLKYEIDLDSFKDQQNKFGWVANLFKKTNYESGESITYSKKLLDYVYERFNCFKEANVTAPENATLSEYKNGGYEIVKEVQGTTVDKDKFYDVIKEAITNLQSEVSIEESDCYVKPTITSEDSHLLEAQKLANLYTQAELTYQFGEKTEILDGAKISQMIVLDDKDNVSIDEAKVGEFVDYIGKTYNTFGKTRTFKTTSGKTIQTAGGDYGWWLNRVAEKKEIIEAIKKGEKKVKEPNYYQKARQYGDDDIGNTYVEVNIATQHVWFYKEGKLVVESSCVSGNLAKGHGTKLGVFSITFLQRKQTLKGQGYSQPVEYWMPFNGDQGLHDANWRHGKFGGSIYKTSGSHGCVNLPPAVAKTIFENIEKGVPVIVY
ncbi:ErfK/YbiS/YcfS/YnhG family protein, putative [Lachnospiraceae bacterium KM106-2]|nr:ErfK/YbiS/YcfS/YnhG family protein, putative [Lachnospiraceae bacterium KM106-2]